MKIVLIGSGNVATVLGKLIKNAGHSIVEIWSRNPVHAKKLSVILGAPICEEYWQLNAEADIYLFAVSDAALPGLLNQFPLKNKLLVHTAGTVPLEILLTATSRAGILYPLQSLKKEANSIPAIPFLVEATDDASLQTIRQLALSLSSLVKEAGFEQRQQLHLAAVIAGNFTNHLYTLASSYCSMEKTDFEYLYPLITEVAKRATEMSPGLSQTGPAIRGDADTMAQHLKLLERYPQLQVIYNQMSKSIINWHQVKPNIL